MILEYYAYYIKRDKATIKDIDMINEVNVVTLQQLL